MFSLNHPSVSNELRVDFPYDHIVLLTLNRPDVLNAMSPTLTDDLKRVLDWFEDEPQLWAAVLTGNGRIFCAGLDLKAALNGLAQNGDTNNQLERSETLVHGFGSLSRRHSRKPIIAAVVGGAYGGGMEILVNCDLVIADAEAKFSFPEVKRGVVASLGGIPRLARICGHQLAAELLLLGKTIDANDAQARFGFVNVIVPADQVLSTAINVAKEITLNSPDAVQSTKVALLLAQKHNVEETFHTHIRSPEARRVGQGANIKEGLRAFVERRKPAWKDPAKL